MLNSRIRTNQILKSFKYTFTLNKKSISNLSPNMIPPIFNGIVLEKEDNKVDAKIRQISRDQLPDLPVSVKIDFSSVNYKDALAINGKPGVIRKYPIVPGIDFSGTVISDRTHKFETGQKVLLTGNGVGEKFWGGFAEYAKVRPEWLIKIPEKMSTRDAMAIGTAGFTAMLCVNAIEKYALKSKPSKSELNILVTGASGGVGSVATYILSRLNYNVTASSGRKWTHKYLKELGANRIIGRTNIGDKIRPLGKEIWDGVVDCVGGETLAMAISQCKYGAPVATCGLTGGTNIPTTVFPFILRSVALLGIDSVYCPLHIRNNIWDRLSKIPLKLIYDNTTEKNPDELFNFCEDMLSGKSDTICGRTIVNCGKFPENK